MPSSGDALSEETSGTTCISEVTIENLRRCREKMLDNLRQSIESAMQFELSDYQRYSHFETVQVAKSFMEDSEDIGPGEDLALLGIK